MKRRACTVLVSCGLTLAVALSSLAAIAGPSSGAARLKGYFEIDQTLRDRISSPGKFSLALYLGETVELYPTSLISLLGVYSASSLDSAFRNGAPNSANIMLWHALLSGLAMDLGKVCDPNAGASVPDSISEAARRTLQPLCAWPAERARSEPQLLDLWLLLMGYDAPVEEFEAWRDFFRGPLYARSSASEAVSAMAIAIFSNPYFLMRN